MKKKLLIGIILSVLIFASVFIFNIMTRLDQKKEANELIQNLPNFELFSMKNHKLTKSNLEYNKPVILVFFDSTCEYCQHEAKEIKKNIELFSKTQIVFISAENLETIERFSLEYKLHNYDNIYFTADRDGQFASRVEATTNPYILVYDSKHKLLKRFKGQTKAEAILNLLQVDF